MDFVSAFNFSTALLIAYGCGWAVLSSRVHTGVIVGFGLILVALGNLLSAMKLVDGLDCIDVFVLGRSAMMIRCGALIIGAGWLLRTRRSPTKKRRATDWADLDWPHVEHK